MTNIKRTAKTFWEVTLPDFLLPHYVSRWDMIKTHISAYINLAFLVILVMGVLYALNYTVSIDPMIKVISPIIEETK